jgi:hypothetical protein
MGNAKGIVASWKPTAARLVVIVLPKQTKREPKIRKPSKRQGAMNYNQNVSFNAADDHHPHKQSEVRAPKEEEKPSAG